MNTSAFAVLQGYMNGTKSESHTASVMSFVRPLVKANITGKLRRSWKKGESYGDRLERMYEERSDGKIVRQVLRAEYAGFAQ